MHLHFDLVLQSCVLENFCAIVPVGLGVFAEDGLSWPLLSLRLKPFTDPIIRLNKDTRLPDAIASK